jgi:hypothetical protein
MSGKWLSHDFFHFLGASEMAASQSVFEMTKVMRVWRCQIMASVWYVSTLKFSWWRLSVVWIGVIMQHFNTFQHKSQVWITGFNWCWSIYYGKNCSLLCSCPDSIPEFKFVCLKSVPIKSFPLLFEIWTLNGYVKCFHSILWHFLSRV